ncbi:MFS general substrate transporter [Aureobasidium subglaciale]|nr:MFS general substrate transporter [Aureobasidium subglaciale]
MQTLLQYRQERRQAQFIISRSLQSPASNHQLPPIETSPEQDEKHISPYRSTSDDTLQAHLSSPHDETDNPQQKDRCTEPPSKISVSCDEDDSDQADPRKWSTGKKLQTTVILFFLVFSQGWVSSCDSNIIKPASEEFHVSQTAETLATALFLLGISVGSLVVGPLSEELGRNPVYLVPSMFYLCFTLGDALAPNFGAQISLRFLAGLSASAGLSIYGGSLADLYEEGDRQRLWPVFALSPLLSPILSPVAGGWIEDYISWRWVYWIGLALSASVYLIAFLFLPETFSPMIIQWRTHHLRQVSGSDEYTCDLEGRDSLITRLQQNLTRPAKFFTTEPIIIALGFYLIVVYVVIFTFLNGFEFIFTDTYRLSPGITSLAFLGICIGALISTFTTPLIGHFFQPSNKDGAYHQKESPERLLIPAVIASPFFAISIFWLGWTNFASISYWSDYAATVVFGYSMTAIFVASYSYIINIYVRLAALPWRGIWLHQG